LDERSSLGSVSKHGYFFRNARARNTHVEANLNHFFFLPRSADGNLKFELDLFHEFDVEGSGKLEKAEFTRGFQKYVARHGVDSPHVADIIRGVRHYKKRGTVEL
jgi:hypothetical protein